MPVLTTAPHNRPSFPTGATDEYTEALSTADAPKHAPLSASIHAGRAAAWLRLKAYDEALKDCAVAIYAQVRSR